MREPTDVEVLPRHRREAEEEHPKQNPRREDNVVYQHDEPVRLAEEAWFAIIFTLICFVLSDGPNVHLKKKEDNFFKVEVSYHRHIVQKDPQQTVEEGKSVHQICVGRAHLEAGHLLWHPLEKHQRLRRDDWDELETDRPEQRHSLATFAEGLVLVVCIPTAPVGAQIPNNHYTHRIAPCKEKVK